MDMCSSCVEYQQFLLDSNDGSQVICYHSNFQDSGAEKTDSTLNKSMADYCRLFNLNYQAKEEMEGGFLLQTKNDGNQGEREIVSTLAISVPIPSQEDDYSINLNKKWYEEPTNQHSLSLLENINPAEKEIKEMLPTIEKAHHIPLICKLCNIGTTYKSRRNLYRHMREKHGAEEQVQILKSRFRVGDDKRRMESKRKNSLIRQLAWMKRINDCTDNVNLLQQSSNDFRHMYYNNKL